MDFSLAPAAEKMMKWNNLLAAMTAFALCLPLQGVSSAHAAEISQGSQGPERGNGSITIRGFDFDKWAKSFAAAYECSKGRGELYDGSGDLEVKGIWNATCERWYMLTHRTPAAREQAYFAQYQRMVDRIETTRDPIRAMALTHKAANLLAKRWEMEQLINRSMGAPCESPPQPLLLTFDGGESRPFQVEVDTGMCGS